MRPQANPYLNFTVEAPTTLLPFVMQALKGVSRSRAKAILSGGGVLVNNTFERQFDRPLKRGDRVAIRRNKPRAELRNRFVRLVYEDDYIVVIEKQTGILSMATSAKSLCVKSVLDDYFHKGGQRARAHVVHRLDRETSGLLVYAKTIEAERILEDNWREIVTDRRYVALVSGVMEQDEGTIESFLKDNAAYVTYSSPTDPGGGKWAVTHFRTLQRGASHSLVELKLETGRKNQIRVHLQDIGHPVCGDHKYGGKDDDPAGRLCLHAYRLCFYHPITGEHLRFETPMPVAFERALR